MEFGQFLGFQSQFSPKKWVSSTFQPDHQFNPKNRRSKDSKTAAVSKFAIIGQLPPSSTGLIQLMESATFQDIPVD